MGLPEMSNLDPQIPASVESATPVTFDPSQPAPQPSQIPASVASATPVSFDPSQPAPRPAAPPAWEVVATDPRFVASSPQDKLDSFDKWHADALSHASTDPQWSTFKDEFNQRAADTRTDLSNGLPLSHPGAAQRFLGGVQEGLSSIAEAGGGMMQTVEQFTHLPEGSLGSTIWNDSAQYWKDHAEKTAPGTTAWSEIPWIAPETPGGKISPVEYTLNKLMPGSTVAELYSGGAQGMRRLVSAFSTPKSMGTLLALSGAGVKGGQAAAAIFTAQGIAQLDDHIAQFQAADNTKDKASIAVQAIGAILLPAAGLLLHTPAEKIPKIPLPNLDKIPEEMLRTGYAQLEPTANPRLSLALAVEIARRSALRVGPETAGATLETQPDIVAKTNKILADESAKVAPVEPVNETINHKGEVQPAAAPEPVLGREAETPAGKLTPALSMPDGAVEAARPGEKTHGDVFNRAANEALKAGEMDKVQDLLGANADDARHVFQYDGKGEPLNRVDAGKLADTTGQRDEAFKGQPLQSHHIQEPVQELAKPAAASPTTASEAALTRLIHTGEAADQPLVEKLQAAIAQGKPELLMEANKAVLARLIEAGRPEDQPLVEKLQAATKLEAPATEPTLGTKSPSSLLDTFTVRGKDGIQREIVSGADHLSEPALSAWIESGVVQKRGEGKPGFELTDKGKQIVQARIDAESSRAADSTHDTLQITPEEGAKGLDSRVAAQRLATNSAASKSDRAFAAAFARLDTGAKIIIEDDVRNKTGDKTAASYKPDTNTIHLQSDLAPFKAHRALLEELYHSADFWLQRHPETPAAKRYAAEVLRIHEIASAAPEAGEFAYALQLRNGRPIELVPNMISNPEFREFLDHLLYTEKAGAAPVAKLTLTAKLLDVMRKALGIQTGSLADRALKNFLNVKQSDVEASRQKANDILPWAERKENLGTEPEDHDAGRQVMHDISDHMSLDTPAGLAHKGAELVLEKGARSYPEWKAAMIAAAKTDQIDFPKVWNDVKAILSDYEAAKIGGKPGRVKSQVAQATGLQDAAAIVKRNMSDAISRAEALTATLAAREQGGKAGRAAGTAETKADLRMADRWMAADQEKVRTDLMEFVNKTLPLDERGRFTAAITRALRRPDLLRGDPGIMYKNAFRVMRSINARADIWYKTERIADIKKAFGRLADSPSVDAAYRGKIKDLMDEVSLTKPSEQKLSNLRSLQDYVARETAAGRDPGVPQAVLDKLDLLTKLPLKDMSINAIDQLHASIERLADLGKLKAKLIERQWEAEKQHALDEMAASPGKAKDARRAVKAQPGEQLTWKQIAINWKNAARNETTALDLMIAPTDMLGDMLDGNKGDYNGWWSRNVKGKLDLAHNAKEAAKAKIILESRAIATKYGLTRENFEHIGVKGIINMIGRDRLKAMGIEDRVLNTIEKQNLSEGEQAYYDYTRKTYDEYGPKIKDLARRLYQEDVELVDKYVPLMRDWAAHAEREPIAPGADPTASQIPFDEKATLRQLQEDTNSQRRTEDGFLKARVEGATTAVKFNAQEIFERHMNDALHFLHSQPVLKMLGEIVATKEFKDKYGDVGQELTHDLLDTVATQGQIAGRLWILDKARKATSKASIAFRLASNLVHLSQIPLAAYHAGGVGWWIRGLQFVCSKEGQAFLRENAAETFTRSGGEPAQAEAEALNRVSRAGFIIGRLIDRINSQTTFMGRYTKEMAMKGVNLDSVLDHPVDAEVQTLALRRMRRAVASPLGKDVPQLISQGKGFSGNVSVARSVTQFKNIFLDIWSNIRHDLLRVGAQDAKSFIESMQQGDVLQGLKTGATAAEHRAAVTAALLMGVAMETGIKHYVKKGIQGSVQAITGAPPTASKKDAQTEAQQLEDEFVHHLMYRLPVVGNVMQMIDYSETGIPVVDALAKPFWETGKLLTSKTPKTKTSHVVRAVTGAATILGVPGVSQAGEIAEPIITKNLRGGRSKGGVGGGL